MTAVASSSNGPPMAKYFASTEKKIRDQAVKKLSTFLSTQESMDKPEMDKLWKGIFYCFWMSDKPLVQQALATELAELVLTISTTEMSLIFLRGFWDCTVREWNGIDRLRMDKYYMLIRRFVNASFRFLAREQWNQDVCDRYNEILSQQGGPLCPTDIKVPSSLAYHLSDIYLEELEKVTEADDPAPPLSTLLSPFLRVASQTASNLTHKHIISSLLDPLLSVLSSEDEPRSKRRRLEEDVEDSKPFAELVALCRCTPSDSGPLGKDALRSRILRTLFEIASEEQTKDANRRKLYTLWEKAGGGDD